MLVGAQDLWTTGSRVYFQRDPVSSVAQPILDLGRIEATSPQINADEQILYDGDGGILRPLASATTKIDEIYDVKCSNLNMDMLAFLFMANPPQAFSQSASPITANHVCDEGRLLKLHDANGIPVYGVTSVTSIAGLTAGTDYELVNAERGLVRFIPGGGLTGQATKSVVFVPRVIASSKRLVNPQDAGGVINGTMMLFWGRMGNQQQTVRECRVSMRPNGANFVTDNWSDMTLRMTVLTDPTLPVPAGRLVYWLGNLPTTD